MAGRTLLMFLVVVLITAGCTLYDADEPSSTGVQPANAQSLAFSGDTSDGAQSVMLNASYSSAPTKPAAQSNAPCPPPDGWTAYQMAINETIYSVAARSGLSAQDLLLANCLTQPSALGPGTWLYVPLLAVAARPDTLLPLSISALVADPVEVGAGDTVHLTWQAQGPVVRVRLGWMYYNQFVEEAADLPAIGTWALTVPDDGRESITYMVRVGDGLAEVAAQTTVHVRCPQDWFFSPSPPGCPSSALVTTFLEQPFEHGTIVYMPAMAAHYVLIAGQPGQRLADTFVPGMPLTDAGLEPLVPAGLRQPSGPINRAWNSSEGMREALGFALGPPAEFTGMLQRVAGPSGDVVYFSSAAGQVVAFANRQPWGVITTQ
ncbi:MAG: LysM peptidoglycan-binding domain-containing protein [Anaerolineae bacterium]|nr:LysM peptidoglycan-binding domain-containing protein [Anaerolineae bacterium]